MEHFDANMQINKIKKIIIRNYMYFDIISEDLYILCSFE